MKGGTDTYAGTQIFGEMIDCRQSGQSVPRHKLATMKPRASIANIDHLQLEYGQVITLLKMLKLSILALNQLEDYVTHSWI